MSDGRTKIISRLKNLEGGRTTLSNGETWEIWDIGMFHRPAPGKVTGSLLRYQDMTIEELQSVVADNEKYVIPPDDSLPTKEEVREYYREMSRRLKGFGTLPGPDTGQHCPVIAVSPPPPAYVTEVVIPCGIPVSEIGDDEVPF